MSAVDLFWMPLGAGGHSVRINGRVYEWIVARHAGRRRRDLFHSALEVRLGGERYVIEVGPVSGHLSHGVVSQGPVGARRARRFRLFRYEVRCWPGGVIPDVAEAVDSPRLLTTDARIARRVLESIGRAPTAVWGRDELRAGEMWNSNSIVAWLLESAGLDAGGIEPPAAGRAPGWRAGVVVARR
jgi:hypothetical protein